MAIEIIPKPDYKTKEKTSIFFIISLIVLIASISVYFYLFLTVDKKSKELEAKEEHIEALINDETFISKEKEVLRMKEKIDEFNNLFKNHHSVLELFSFLEKNTHIKVAWESSAFSKTTGKEAPAYKLSLSGKSDNFIILAQQIIVLRSRPEISEIKLSSLAIEEKGKVSFNFEIVFNPGLFVFK